LLKRGRGWAIRWREIEIAPDGTKKKVLRYERLGEISRKDAAEKLAQKLAMAGKQTALRSRVTFRTVANDWQAHVVPMYKHSTQKNHRHILAKHLMPHFGDMAMCEVTRQTIQVYVTHLMRREYAPKIIDHIHDVLSAVLRTAVKWGQLQENPARGVDLPRLRNVRPKWALTTSQAEALLNTAAARTDDGRTGAAVWASARRVVRAPVEGPVERKPVPHRS
jgi:hypothetical protein